MKLFTSALTDSDWIICQEAFENFSLFTKFTPYPQLIQDLLPPNYHELGVNYFSQTPYTFSSKLDSIPSSTREVDFFKELFFKISMNRSKPKPKPKSFQVCFIYLFIM